MNHQKISRRIFIIGAGAALSGCAMGGVRRTTAPKVSPNEKLNVAAIGAGGKGRSDIHSCSRENVVALADADWRRAAETFSEFPDAKRYKDFREMLDKHPEIDALTISTPDHFHAVAAMECMARGKHVYVQKPLTHCIGEARALTLAARKYGVATQMGNQGHSGDGVRKLCEMIWHGDIGQVHECHIWTDRPHWPQGIGRPTETPPAPETLDWDLWLGPAPRRPYNPAYAPFSWRGWWDFGCGALGDMACHIADPANWALRLYETGPTSVEVVEIENLTKETYPTMSTIRFEFPRRGHMDPVTVYWHDGKHADGAPNRPSHPEGVPPSEKMGDGDNGTLFIGTKGVATAGEYGGKPRLLPGSAMADYEFPPETIPRIPRQNPYGDWIRAAKGGEPATSNFDYAGPFTEWVLLGNLAMRYSQKLEYDAQRMRVTNLPEANDHILRAYHNGWKLGT